MRGHKNGGCHFYAQKFAFHYVLISYFHARLSLKTKLNCETSLLPLALRCSSSLISFNVQSLKKLKQLLSSPTASVEEICFLETQLLQKGPLSSLLPQENIV